MTTAAGLIFLAQSAVVQPILGGMALPALVFEFPDGVRGGYGKIQGTAKMPDSFSPDFKLEQTSQDFSLEQIRKCGASDARYSKIEISHRRIVVAASTGRDREIVECVKRSVSTHFSVFIFEEGAPRNDVPFREFWSSPPTLGDKAR